MTVECPHCNGAKTDGVNRDGRPMACPRCGGTGSLRPDRAMVYAMQHPGSPLGRQLAMPFLATVAKKPETIERDGMPLYWSDALNRYVTIPEDEEGASQE